jgi:hypothetical protein
MADCGVMHFGSVGAVVPRLLGSRLSCDPPIQASLPTVPLRLR